ncbi:hypothetical protein TSUD_153280 [Trifolium subterraneum]|uniref:NB-ARC domain-containing protein n=1 Tax=Trifolium subterraneum TaxID=3900 RepID=A0A2Z6MCP0_TRISU|nr:hypothetical protein TSUD_153280 [Trifolium subterraneum]
MIDPCASILSCARENLLPLARKHLLPLARDHMLPILNEAVNMIRGVPNDVIKHMKHELETIEEFIHQADKMADADETNSSDGTRQKIKQLIEAFFRMQDLIDEYIVRVEQQLPDPGCAAGASHYVKTKFLRLQIAHDIQKIKSQINEMQDTSIEKDHGFQIISSSEQGSSSSAINPKATSLQNLRMAPFYMKEADVVGFEKPRDKLVDWLVNGRDELTVISVVAMGGQGKTTLARKVFDSKELEKLPEWIPKHQNLVQLVLNSSKLTEDPMKLLKSMPNLLSIYLIYDGYVGETLHFQNEWFKNLKELQLYCMDNLKSILIDQGALPSLEKLYINSVPRLHRLPTGIQHLKKLELLDFRVMSEEFRENILLNGGKDHWIFKQVPSVRIVDLIDKSI